MRYLASSAKMPRGNAARYARYNLGSAVSLIEFQNWASAVGGGGTGVEDGGVASGALPGTKEKPGSNSDELLQGTCSPLVSLITSIFIRRIMTSTSAAGV